MIGPRRPGLTAALLLGGLSPVFATCSALLLDVPDSVDPGKAISITWQVTSSSPVSHTDIHYRINQATTEGGSAAFSFAGGTQDFTATISGAGLHDRDDVYVRAHVRNAEGDCYSATMRVPIIDSTLPPVPTPDSFEPDNQCGSAKDITPGGPSQLHSISPPGDADAGAFLALAGLRYAVETQPQNGSRGIETQAEVRDPQGALVASDNHGGTPPWTTRAEFTAATTGRHCALISGPQEKDGWYAVRVTVVQARSCATDPVAVPAAAAPGVDLQLSWAAWASADITHTNLHYFLPGDQGERGTAALTAAAGPRVFTATLPSASWPVGTAVRVRSHVQLRTGTNCYSTYRLVIVLPANQPCVVALDKVPTGITAGQSLTVLWWFASATAVSHADLHYSGYGGSAERSGPVHSGDPGQHSFTDTLPVSSWPAGTTARVRGHARTAAGQDFYTPLSSVVIQQPPAVCSTALYSVPATVPQGSPLAFQWWADSPQPIVHTDVHFRRKGETVENSTPAETGTGLYWATIDTTPYPAGTVLEVRSHVRTQAGENCYSPWQPVTIVAAGSSAAAAEAGSGSPVTVRVLCAQRVLNRVQVTVAVQGANDTTYAVGVTWQDRAGRARSVPPQTGRGCFRASFSLPGSAVRVRPWVSVGDSRIYGTTASP